MFKMFDEFVVDLDNEMPPKGWHFHTPNGQYEGWGSSSDGIRYAIVRKDEPAVQLVKEPDALLS